MAFPSCNAPQTELPRVASQVNEQQILRPGPASGTTGTRAATCGWAWLRRYETISSAVKPHASAAPMLSRVTVPTKRLGRMHSHRTNRRSTVWCVGEEVYAYTCTSMRYSVAVDTDKKQQNATFSEAMHNTVCCCAPDASGRLRRWQDAHQHSQPDVLHGMGHPDAAAAMTPDVHSPCSWFPQ